MSSQPPNKRKKTTKKSTSAKGRGTPRKSKPRERSPVARGNELLNHVIRLTGLPAKTIRKDLKAILDRKNLDVNHLTLDELRTVVACYLREIMSGLLERRMPDRPSRPTH